MSIAAGDLEGVAILKKLAKRQRAKAILQGSDKLHWTFSGLAIGVASAVTGHVMDEVAAPEHVVWLASFSAAVIAGIFCEQSRQGKRLDALVTLANLDD